METMYYIGLDVHKKTISYCVKDGNGRIYAAGSIPATRLTLDMWMKTLPQPCDGRVVVELYDNQGKKIGTAPNDKTSPAFRSDLQQFLRETLPARTVLSPFSRSAPRPTIWICLQPKVDPAAAARHLRSNAL